MSLKAKLEAVIYASEEPVTLAQLTTLFTDEALEWKSAVEAAAAAETLAFPEPEPEAAVEPESEPEAPASEPYPEEAAPKPESETEAETAPAAQTADFALKPEPEAEAQREAKLREREAREILRKLLAELIDDYKADARGVEIREIAGGYRMATKPECHDAVRSFVKSLKPALKLSLPALETLAVVAYKQPITAPEVGDIRGVDSAGVLGSLISRKLVTTAGRKQVIGRPILYKTTREFLLRFGLKDTSELPSMEEFEKMAALELAEEDTETPTEPEAAERAAVTESEAEPEPVNGAENEVVIDAETAVEADSEPQGEVPPQAASPAEE